MARHQPDLFRDIIRFARERYNDDKKTYHVSATLQAVAASGTPAQLEDLYLERWHDVPPHTGFTRPGRQILHCTFGSVLTHPTFGPAVRHVLVAYADSYANILAEHFARHLEALAAGL